MKNYTMKLIQCKGDVPMSALIVSIPLKKQFMEHGDKVKL
ncbi:hypothetical protein bcere0007_31710 [Bacillus mycoides]|nr:hypothetical protein bcere0007_31710 [Bacillus mycoides]